MDYHNVLEVFIIFARPIAVAIEGPQVKYYKEWLIQFSLQQLKSKDYQLVSFSTRAL